MAVTPAMLAVALGQAAPEPGSITEQQWSMWVDDAYMLIEDRQVEVGKTDQIDEAKLDYVVRQAVVSHIKKPDDATEITISIDDASSSRKYQSGKGRVSLDGWWAFLGLAGEQGGAFSIDTVASTSPHWPWCARVFGAAYCSCGLELAGTPIFEVGT